jgi:hypothetical protein
MRRVFGNVQTISPRHLCCNMQRLRHNNFALIRGITVRNHVGDNVRLGKVKLGYVMVV